MQGELFNDPTRPALEEAKPTPAENWLNRFRVTLRIDHLSVAAISALILYVLVFSFGVEKGKEMALSELEAEKAKQRQMAGELESVQADAGSPATEVPNEVSGPVPAVPVTQEASTAVLTGKYTLQLITFTSRPRAEEEVKKLRAKGHRAFILPSGKFFLVCAEAFEEMKDAREKLEELQTGGDAPDDAYVRSLNAPVTL